ncbi:endonuclease/exonuclease/phosphatase family protein, putative [Plasmodium ovale]|uniref:Endonuclease/exonuclease/phosphatase family protein, putative n=2 Tax=Plasmodium ovale TaxID=36330 RepID=A0A1A8VTD0_PLAOA|nr:endonuclease/exonuclease/phosphatase family protein, putative [Plasmodium ovale curtisi]SBS89058.1 endonuclease/exonuclease/phosphatase family protein, putative [Plasmodium ovale curtisi]SCP04199.1 endonuclease/exonuclease/phosphatase family protein, putative [Plasmodium ovale]
MPCVTCNVNIIRYAFIGKLNKIHQRKQHCFVKRNFFRNRGRKNSLFFFPIKIYHFVNKSGLPPSIKINHKKNYFILALKAVKTNFNHLSKIVFSQNQKKEEISYRMPNKKTRALFHNMSLNISEFKPDDIILAKKENDVGENEDVNRYVSLTISSEMNDISNNKKETNGPNKTDNCLEDENKVEAIKSDDTPQKKEKQVDYSNYCEKNNVNVNTSSKQFITCDDADKYGDKPIKNDKEIVLFSNCHQVSNYDKSSKYKECKILTVLELEDMKKISSYLKINETENDEFSIELYFDFKELKLLRKKEETLNSLINRLTLNLKKLDKKKKKKSDNKKNKNNESNDDILQNEEITYCIKFFDSENNLIYEYTILKDIIDKLSYVLINEMKICIYKGMYNLKEIHISMDVYAGHPVIPVNMPMNDIKDYIYYWIQSSNKNVIKSRDLFYKPNKDDISKNIQLVIYNKKTPFFYYTTEEVYVNQNKFEEELKMKENRYLQFKKLLSGDGNGVGSRDGNIIRILSYNILAPIYTNTKYALEYMFKNVDASYLKTNYRSHLLIHEINHDYDVISLQEVSEYLHSSLFSVYLHEHYYSSYKPKNSYGNDGCSLFVNKKKFTLIEYKNYEFHEIIKKIDLKEVYDMFIKLSDDLEGIIREIKTVFQVGIYVHNSSQNIFLIANTHFYFHSLANHIRAIQSYCLLHILEVLKSEYKEKYSKNVYVVLNGDFNTNFESEVFSFLEGKDILSDSDVWINAKLFKKEYDDLNTYPNVFDLKKNKDDISEQINGPFLDRKKFLPLRSVYKKGDIAYTNWNNNFIDVLDYIFISPDLKIRRILKGIDQNIFDKYKGLLSPINPSDHLSIAAEVEI